MTFAAYFASTDEIVVLLVIAALGVAALWVWSRLGREHEDVRWHPHHRCTTQHRHVRLIGSEHTKESYDHIG